jgi:hypothetical protein
MTLKERWSARRADWGETLHTYGFKLVAIIGAIGELTNMLNMIPQGLVIPNWLRYTIWGCAAISFVVSNYSVKKETPK